MFLTVRVLHNQPKVPLHADKEEHIHKVVIPCEFRLQLQAVFHLLYDCPSLLRTALSSEPQHDLVFKPYTREEGHYKVILRERIKYTVVAIKRTFDLCKQIHDIISFAKVVKNVIIIGSKSQLIKLLLECAGLLKQTVYHD